jgi:pSer/pThr/pTyr-binding forkhead associated (FHA) protein
MKFCTKCGSAVGVKAASLTRLKTGEKIKIDGQEFVIGKKQDKVNYCILDNPAVSRVHAKIIKRDGQYFIIDMGSTNHTYVNGTQAPANLEVPINNGARIRISNEEFAFEA